MRKITGIYKIENNITKKCYIGQAKDIEKRWLKHRSEPFNEHSHSYDYPLYRAIRKYGIENFSFVILEECSVSELNQKEMEYISQHNAFFNGYNQTLGGDTSAVVEKEKILGIINDLENTDMFHKEIAEKWNISIEMVQGINTGRYWKYDRKYPIQTKKKPIIRTIAGSNTTVMLDGHSKQEVSCIDCGTKITYGANRCVKCGQKHNRKCDRPSKDVLLELLKQTHNFSQVAKQYGVTDNAVRKWCKTYGLPYKTSDYINNT